MAIHLSPGPSSASRRLAALRWSMALAGVSLLVIAGIRMEREHRRELARREARLPLQEKLGRLAGTHARVAWLRDFSPDRRDIFANGGALSLMVMDSNEPQPMRELVGQGPLRRPLITPDGASVVFSRMPKWQVEETAAARTCEIWIVPWQGGQARRLGSGFALDVWQAPDGRTWVLAMEQMGPVGANHNGRDLVRFPMDAPERREPLLRGREITADNFQVDRSGASASALLPWPAAGTVDLQATPEGQFHPLLRGCWPALAPDDSGLAWIFDGAHKRLRMVHQPAGRAWEVSLTHVDGMRKAAGYHPRWSNHPSFIVWTGPYRKPFRNKGAGREACIFVGRLTPAADDVETALKLDDGAVQPDIYPDLWLAGAGEAALDPAALALARKARPFHVLSRAADWPGSAEGLRWAWKAARVEHTDTEADFGAPQLRGHAWLAREGILCLQGGWADAGPWAGDAPTPDKGWGLTLVVEPLRLGGILLTSPLVTLRQETDGCLAIHHAGGAWITRSPLPADCATVVAFDQPTDRTAPSCHFGADAVALAPLPSPAFKPAASLRMGADSDGAHPWHGFMGGISLWTGERAASLTLRTADGLRTAATGDPSPRLVARVVVEAVSMPLGPDDLGSYPRAWTGGVVRVLSVSRGDPTPPRLNVAWWTIMDRRPIPGALPAPGTELELVMEPADRHPFFESERGADDLEEETLPWFIAIDHAP